MRRVGIYPGTFDPVHHGHVAFAQAAAAADNLDHVLFLPERQPRDKVGVSPLAQRLAWLEQALKDIPHFSATILDSQQFSVIQTLPEIQKLSEGAEITLLLGSDVARGLPQWPDLDQLLQQAHLVVGLRAGDQAADLQALLAPLQTRHSNLRLHLISSPYPHASSSRL